MNVNMYKCAAAALLLVALAGVNAHADQGALGYVPGDSNVVILVDFEALATEPQAAAMVSQLDQVMKANPDAAGFPSLMDLKGLGIGLKFDPAMPDAGPTPSFVAQCKTSVASMTSMLEQKGFMKASVGGSTAYTAPEDEYTVALSGSGDTVFVSPSTDSIATMMQGGAGMHAAARAEIVPAKGPMPAPVLYIHVGELKTMMGAKYEEAMNEAQMGLDQAISMETEGSQKKLLTDLKGILPDLFAMSGADVYVGFDTTNLSIVVKFHLRSAGAAESTKKCLDDYIASEMAAAAQNPAMAQQAQMLQGVRSRTEGSTAIVQVDQNKQMAMMIAQMAMGGLASQMMSMGQGGDQYGDDMYEDEGDDMGGE